MYTQKLSALSASPSSHGCVLPPSSKEWFPSPGCTSLCSTPPLAHQAVSVSTENAKKRPATLLSPSNLSPLAQRIRSDIQIGESSEVESPEKEVLRSSPCPEKSPSPVLPCAKDFPSPAPLVFTPLKEKHTVGSCLNCDAEMTPDHQCETLDSESNWEDVESEAE